MNTLTARIWDEQDKIENTYLQRKFNCKQYNEERNAWLYIRTKKFNQMENWTNLIEKYNNEIAEIRANSTMIAAEKDKKIKRRMELIALYEKDIADAQKHTGITLVHTR